MRIRRQRRGGPGADPDAIAFDGLPAAHVEDTPDTPTIDTLVAASNANHPRADGRAWTAADTLKNVIVMLTHPDGTREPLAIGVPGDREVDEKRLAAQVEPATVGAFEETDFTRYASLAKGYIGPGVLGQDRASGIRYLLDPRVSEGTAWITGADEHGKHVFDLVVGRDFTADGTIEAAEVRDGDGCPSCGHGLETARGIEMGHIFQLGRKYAEALDLKVLDQHGKLQTVIMGSYGVGVSRAVACIAEGNHDGLGLVWPRAITPADAHIVATGKDDAVFTYAEELTRELEATGVEVLLDDRRQVSPGVKFKDAELIGVPTIVVVGRGLADGEIELKDRRTNERRNIALESAVAEILAEIRSA